MAMRTASPWWASLAFGIGLLVTFVSERFLSHQQGLRVALTGLGVGVLIAVAGARLWTTLASKGNRRKVERTLLICHLGTLLALALYALTTKWGMNLLGIEEKNVGRVGGALTVLWSIFMLASIAPVLMIELSLGLPLRTNFDIDESDEAGVEYYRVREIGWSGLTVAFAAAFLMVTCNVARERNISKDVSYFKTSSPGGSTRNIVASATETIRVHLFFPDANEVKEQVHDYFKELASATGKLEVTLKDRIGDAELANKYQVKKDGFIVIARGKDEGEKFFTLEIDTDLEKARKGAGKLRNLDREINSLLMKLVREKRKAYLIKGHGEISDPESVPAEAKGRTDRSMTKFRARMAELNYELKDLTAMDLVRDVPSDATMVILLGPSLPMQPAEWESLDRYLMRGGRLLIALDPLGEPSMGVLEGRLGLKMGTGLLLDGENFMPIRGSITDRRIVMTNQFTAHATTTAVSRGHGGPFVTIEAGGLEDTPFTSQGEAPKKTITIRSMDGAWLDFNANFQFDATGPKPEKKQKWNLGAVIEGPKIAGKDGFRAVVYSDADFFADVLAPGAMGRAQVRLLSGNLLTDTVRWLGGEEIFAGEIVSEDDKAIQHSKNEDAVWFTLTTVGAPLLVLTLGLVGTWARRRRRNEKKEVSP